MDNFKISTAEEFKAQFLERQKQEAEPVTLPSGLSIMVRRPKPDWWLRHMGQLPTSMAAQLTGKSEESVSSDITMTELIEYSKWAIQIVQEIIVSPTVKLNPGPGEVDPNWITDDDLRFLVKYAGGEVSADSTNLDAFPQRL
jgi:hypothetical protein